MELSKFYTKQTANAVSQLTTTFEVAIFERLCDLPGSFPSAGLSKKPPSCSKRGTYILTTMWPIGGLFYCLLFYPYKEIERGLQAFMG